MPQISLIHGISKKQILFPHSITDLDAFTPNLVGYWAIYTVLDEDYNSKEEELDNLALKIKEKGLAMSQEEFSDYEFKFRGIERDLKDILKIMDRSVDAYKWAI